jgi:NhaP-type Na+/H+ or K+/H+ antiporter
MMGTFLPDWPLPLSAMAVFGAILLVGAIGAALANRSRFLPAVMGYLLVGLLLGPGGLNWLSADLIASTQFLIDIASAIVLFELGRRLDLGWLRYDRGLLFTARLASAF